MVTGMQDRYTAIFLDWLPVMDNAMERIESIRRLTAMASVSEHVHCYFSYYCIGIDAAQLRRVSYRVRICCNLAK
jgi:hypothetical protein